MFAVACRHFNEIWHENSRIRLLVILFVYFYLLYVSLYACIVFVAKVEISKLLTQSMEIRNLLSTWIDGISIVMAFRISTAVQMLENCPYFQLLPYAHFVDVLCTDIDIYVIKCLSAIAENCFCLLQRLHQIQKSARYFNRWQKTQSLRGKKICLPS